MFRNSTPLSDGQFASGAFNSYFLITYKDGLIASGTSSIRLTGSVTTINATCQVADQTVKLQSIAAARLNGVGTYAAVTPFNLVVAGCPRGYNRVGYS
ncbi:type 1 fimbrial protein, partial [Escherichia coli]|nr:type 1 fimbrial protein [Escherichia coli]